MTEWSPEAKARYHDEMQRLRGTSTETPSPAMYEERIRLLEAERQQAQRERDEQDRRAIKAEYQRQQAIDALRLISIQNWPGISEGVEAADFADYRLVKLGRSRDC